MLQAVVREPGPCGASCLQAEFQKRRGFEASKASHPRAISMQRQSKGDLPLTFQNSGLYTFLSKKRVIAFVFLDSAGMQREGETCENLEGKRGQWSRVRRHKSCAQRCVLVPRTCPASRWETFSNPRHLPEPLSVYRKRLITNT